MPTPSDEAILQRLLLLLCSADATNRELGMELARSQGWHIEEEMQFERWRAWGVNPWGLFSDLRFPYNLSQEQLCEAMDLLRETGQHIAELHIWQGIGKRANFCLLRPLDMSQFRRLRILYLAGFAHSVTNLRSLSKQLTYLSLNFEELQEEIGDFERLHYLDIYGDGVQANSLPAVVGRLRSLGGINLHRCHLRHLPEVWGDMRLAAAFFERSDRQEQAAAEVVFAQ